jgi:hypothetical protein
VNAITRPAAPHATAAASELRDAILPAHRALAQAVQQYRSAYAGLAPDADLLEVMKAVGELVIASEAISAAAKHAESVARSSLAQALMDTGACSVRTSTHIFSASPGRQSVTITDAAAVPDHLLHQPPPSPDRGKILRLLKAGQQIPGCEISTSSQPFLTIKAIAP